MNKTEFDEKMKNMLHECADDLHAPDTMKTRVDFALRSAQVKPRHRWGSVSPFSRRWLLSPSRARSPQAVSAALRAIRGQISA